MTKPKSLAALAITALFLAACGSSGGIGDILGGGGSGSGQASNYEIRGVVDHVDTASRSVYLRNVSGYTSMLSSGGSGSTVRVYYDNQTQVRFGGQTYQVSDLEPGDEVSVNVAESGNNLVADVVTVTRDVSMGGSSPSVGIGSTLRGTVRYVDTSRRTIEVDRGSGSTVIVEYASNTPVYFNGRNYMVADLERGDEIEIGIRDLGSGRYSANDITVTRSVSGTTSGSTSGSTMSGSTIRGTVAFIDASRRTIELESVSYGSNFNRGSGTNRVTISYDAGLNIDVNGRMHPISGLERGDVIEVQVGNTAGNVLYANRMWLVRDVNSF
jgi:hypothetical protein